MTPDEVIALVQAGERLGAKEALFSLGDKPEAAFAEHREFLRRMGHRTTLGYLRAVAERVVARIRRSCPTPIPASCRSATSPRCARST